VRSQVAIIVFKLTTTSQMFSMQPKACICSAFHAVICRQKSFSSALFEFSTTHPIKARSINFRRTVTENFRFSLIYISNLKIVEKYTILPYIIIKMN
jgi:hypothetical protein